MFAQIKDFILAHKKGIAITTGTVALGVVAYKVYTGTQVTSNDVNNVIEGTAQVVDPVIKAANVYQA